MNHDKDDQNQTAGRIRIHLRRHEREPAQKGDCVGYVVANPILKEQAFMKLLISLACIGILSLTAAQAKLAVTIAEPKRTGEKSVIKATFKNTFSEKVESARATLFLLDDQGKPVEQITRWVIGGSKDQPALAAGASATYNFVVTTEKPFTSTKLVFSRIVLEGGKVVDPSKDSPSKRSSRTVLKGASNRRVCVPGANTAWQVSHLIKCDTMILGCKNRRRGFHTLTGVRLFWLIAWLWAAADPA